MPAYDVHDAYAVPGNTGPAAAYARGLFDVLCQNVFHAGLRQRTETSLL